jgi:hypothetical protein
LIAIAHKPSIDLLQRVSGAGFLRTFAIGISGRGYFEYHRAPAGRD